MSGIGVLLWLARRGLGVMAVLLRCTGRPACPRRLSIVDCMTWRQGLGKVANRPICLMTPRRGPAPRDRVGPGRESSSSGKHVRTFGTDRDFAGTLSPRHAKVRRGGYRR